MSEDARGLLRHTLATLAYRGGKAVRGAPAGFAAFRVSPTSRTPAEILAHIGDLIDWVHRQADGRGGGQNSTPLDWDAEVARFHRTLEEFDRFLASDAPLAFPATRLFQGGLADALTHVGQINLLRRAAGSPVRGENYFAADIVTGRCGPEQSPPRREFD